MSSTHLSLHFHIVFGTKGHKPVIETVWRPRLHAYIGGVLSNLEVVPEIVGGVEDHVHILLGLRRVESLSDLMCKVKSNSSRWVHDEIGSRGFAWQEGYGAFTIGASQREIVRRYIANQEEHHKKQSFKEEYLEFLHKYGVDFDPRYI